MKSLYEMEELKRFQESKVDEFSRRRLIENQDTIHELAARKELQNEVNCLNDSRDFADAESVRSGLSHVPSQPAWPDHWNQRTETSLNSRPARSRNGKRQNEVNLTGGRYKRV